MDDVIENKFYRRPSDIGERQYSVHDNNGFPLKHHNNNLSRSDSVCSKQKDDGGDATFLFWTLVVFILILAVGNLILTFVILGVLRLGNGMESLQLINDHNIIKFFGNTDLNIIDKPDGRLFGFADVPMDITGDGSSVLMRINNAEHISPSIDVGIGASYIQVDSFSVTHPSTGVPIFSTKYPDFDLPKGVDKLNVKSAQTKRVMSPLDGRLLIKSDSIVKMVGAEGTRIDGKEVVWSADQDIFLKSVNKSIILSGHEGVYLNLKYIPVVKDARNNETQYKICVCMPNGRLFRVPVSRMGGASCVLENVPARDHPCYP